MVACLYIVCCMFAFCLLFNYLLRDGSGCLLLAVLLVWFGFGGCGGLGVLFWLWVLVVGCCLLIVCLLAGIWVLD